MYAVVFLCCILQLAQSEVGPCFKRIAREQHMKPDDKIIVLVGSIGDCSKCMTNFGDQLLCLAKFDEKKHNHIIAIVNTDREKEVAAFVSETGWAFPVYTDRGKLDSLGISLASRLVILSDKGIVMRAFSTQEFEEIDCSIIQSAIAHPSRR